jgi:hypothetical protein
MINNNYEIIERHYRCDLKPLIHYRDEEFRPVILPDSNDEYLVSNYGRVYNCTKGFFISQYTNRNGYRSAKLNGHNKLVHRLELQAFEEIEDPENYDVNHKNGYKEFNWFDNLEWMTRSENVQHGFDTGLSKKGEDHPNSKYTEDQIHFICKCLHDGLTGEDVCNILNITDRPKIHKLIYKLRKGEAWRHVTKNYNIAK